MVFDAVFIGEKIYSNEKEAVNLSNKSAFGEFKDGKVFYSLVEALYLVDKKKMIVFRRNRKLGFDELLKILRKIDKKIQIKYLVFKDLREKGYIVKTALKFGAEFRVYPKGGRPGKVHARWILYAVNENKSFSWQDFSAKNRVAHSTRKNLLIGIVDEENSVTYYEVSWVKP